MARIWLHAQTGHSQFTEGAGPWHTFGCMHRQVIPDLQRGQGHGTHLVEEIKWHTWSAKHS